MFSLTRNKSIVRAGIYGPVCVLCFTLLLVDVKVSARLTTTTIDGQTKGEYICPEDWQRIPRAGVYGLVNWAACVRKSDVPLTWSEAMDECRERRSGAQLLILDDEFYQRYEPTDYDDDDRTRRQRRGKDILVQLQQILADHGMNTSWVSLRGDGNTAVWEDVVPITHSPSSDIYDIDYSAMRRPGCFALTYNLRRPRRQRRQLERVQKFKLTRLSCLCRLDYMCIMPAANVQLKSATGDINVVNRCEINWLSSSDVDRCYLPGQMPGGRTATFTDANAFCQSQGGTLATPTDSFLHNFTTAAFVSPSLRTTMQLYPRDRRTLVKRSISQLNEMAKNWTCPPPTRSGSCDERCNDDLPGYECPGSEKCCFDGCSRRCQKQPSSDMNSMFWIGLFANRSTTTGSRWSYVFGDVIDGDSAARNIEGCLAVVMDSLWPVTWSVRNCNETIAFMCEKPKQPLAGSASVSAAVAVVQVRRSDQHQWRLGCQASNYDPDRPVVWVRSTASTSSPEYIDNGLPPHGFDLDLVQLYHTIRRSSGTVFDVTELQGYYHCEVWGALGRAISNRILFKFADVATFRTYHWGRIFTPLSDGRSMIGSMLVVTKSETTYDERSIYVNVTLGEVDSKQSGQPETRDSMITWYSYINDRVHGDALRTLAELSVSDVIEMEGTVYNAFILRRTDACGVEANSGNSVHYDDIAFPVTPLGEVANSSERCALDALGFEDGSGNLGNYDYIESNISEEYENSEHYDFTFPVTQFGEDANSRERCALDGVPLAVGQCTGDFLFGGLWRIVRRHHCSNLPSAYARSRVTEELAELDSYKIDSNNLARVTSSLADLIRRDLVNMTSLDVAYASAILNRISVLPVGDEEVTSQFFDVISSLADIDSDVLLGAESMSASATRLVSAVEQFMDNVVLPSNVTSLAVSRKNVAIRVFELPLSEDADVKENLVYGISLDRRGNVSADDDIRIYQAPVSPDDVISKESGVVEGAILLSRDVLEIGRRQLEDRKNIFKYEQQSAAATEENKLRVSFAIYHSVELFRGGSSASSEVMSRDRDDYHSSHQRATVNSIVISASINGVWIDNLTEPVAVVFRVKERNSSLPQRCAFWKVINGSVPTWSTEGVSTDASMVNDSGTVVCFSRHLTNFAVIAGFDLPRETTVAKVLEVISLVGLSLSIVGLALTILSHMVLYRKLKRTNSQLVLLHLSVSLLAVDVLVIGGLDKVDGPPAVCKTVAALLLYFLLVAFAWMLVEAVVQYLKFVKVFNTYTSRFMLKTSLPSYILPGVIVAVVALIDFYGTPTLRGPSGYCWLSRDAFKFAFLLPLGLVMVTNIVLFVLIVKGLTCDRGVGLQSNQSKTELVKLQVMALICCFIVMGLTWVFAFFAVESAATPMHFLFCIFNSLQGFLIFAFLNVRERLVRQAWMKLLAGCCRRTGRESVSGVSKSTDTARAPAPVGGINDRRSDNSNRTYSSTKSETQAMMTSRSDDDKLTTDTTNL